MSKAIVKLDTLTDVMALGDVFAQSRIFPDVKTQAQAVVKIMAGAELGLGPFASMNGFYIQHGKATPNANLQAAIIRSDPRYDYKVEQLDDNACRLICYVNGEAEGISEFTMADAERAGLKSGPNSHSWKKYPRNMLFARAVSNAARWYFPDAFGGIAVYTPEELDIVVDGETGEIVEGEVAEVSEPSEPPAPAPEPRKANGDGNGRKRKAAPAEENGSPWHTRAAVIQRAQKELGDHYDAAPHVINALRLGEQEQRISWDRGLSDDELLRFLRERDAYEMPPLEESEDDTNAAPLEWPSEQAREKVIGVIMLNKLLTPAGRPQEAEALLANAAEAGALDGVDLDDTKAVETVLVEWVEAWRPDGGEGDELPGMPEPERVTSKSKGKVN